MSIVKIWLLLVLFAISGVILFYKNEKLVKNEKAYLSVVIFTILLAMLAYFSTPNEFYIDRIISIIDGLAAILTLFIKKKMFFLSKIILIISMSISIAVIVI